MYEWLGGILAGICGKRDRYNSMVTEDWLQGRSAFGGLSAAMAVRAMHQHVGEGRPLRSVMTSFVGPLGPGACEITVEELRMGRNVQHLTARVLQDRRVATMVTAAFGAGRDEPGVPSAVAFTGAPRTSVPAGLGRRGGMPDFLSRFEMHWTGGGRPMSGNRDRNCGLWARPKDGMEDFKAERLVALADLPPPVMMSWFTKPLNVSSVTWSLEFVRQPEEMSGEWVYLDYDLEASRDGYSQQSGKVFDESGQLLLVGRQCMVYFSG